MEKRYLYTITRFIPNPTWVSEGWENKPWEVERWKVVKASEDAYSVISPWGTVYNIPRWQGIDGSCARNENHTLYPMPVVAMIARQKSLQNTIERAKKEMELAKKGLKKIAELVAVNYGS